MPATPPSGRHPGAKSIRAANYLVQLRKELLKLSRACGVAHPALVTLDHLSYVDDRFGVRSASEVFDYEPGWGVPSDADVAALDDVGIGRPTERP